MAPVTSISLPVGAVRSRCLSPTTRTTSPLMNRTPLERGPRRGQRQAPQLRAQSPSIAAPAPQGSRSACGEGASWELPPPHSQGQTGLLIWFHGLAMSGTEFGEEFQKGIAQRMPWLQLHYPDAPRRAVTYRGGEYLRAWFDLQDMPVSMGIEHAGLQEATARAHEMIRQAEKNGIPASRIVLGGFSQGGALALRAGLTYEHPVAGIAAFSAWLPGNLQYLRNVLTHSDISIFMGHGDEDRAVPYQEGLASHQALKDVGFKKTQLTKYRGFPHGFVPEEFGELEKFLLQELPNVPQPFFMPQRHVKFGKSERKPSIESTEVGSGSDSPPTTDDESPAAARLGHSCQLNGLHFMPGRTSPVSSHRAARQNRASLDGMSPSLSFFPPTRSVAPGSPTANAFRDVTKGCRPQSPTMRQVTSPSFAASASSKRLQRGSSQNQNRSFNPTPATSWTARRVF